jgi:hypothetical protein
VSTKKNEASGHIPIAEDKLLKMKQSILVEELKECGQVVDGKNKEVLLDPLRLALKKKIAVGKKRGINKKVENPKTDKTRDKNCRICSRILLAATSAFFNSSQTTQSLLYNS